MISFTLITLNNKFNSYDYFSEGKQSNDSVFCGHRFYIPQYSSSDIFQRISACLETAFEKLLNNGWFCFFEGIKLKGADNYEQYLRNEVERTETTYLQTDDDPRSLAHVIVVTMSEEHSKQMQRAKANLVSAQSEYEAVFDKSSLKKKKLSALEADIENAYSLLRRARNTIGILFESSSLPVFSLHEFSLQYALALSVESNCQLNFNQIQQTLVEHRQRMQPCQAALTELVSLRETLQEKITALQLHLAESKRLLQCPLTGELMVAALALQVNVGDSVHIIFFNAPSLGIKSLKGQLIVAENIPASAPFCRTLANLLGVCLNRDYAIIEEEIAIKGLKVFIETVVIPHCRPAYKIAELAQKLNDGKIRNFYELPEDCFDDPILYEMFSQPTTLQCGHSFSRETLKVEHPCPLCREPIDFSTCYPDILLQTLVTTYRNKAVILQQLSQMPEINNQMSQIQAKIAATEEELEALAVVRRQLEDRLAQCSAPLNAIREARDTVMTACSRLSDWMSREFAYSSERESLVGLFSAADRLVEQVKSEIFVTDSERSEKESDLNQMKCIVEMTDQEELSYPEFVELKENLLIKFDERDGATVALFEQSGRNRQAERKRNYKEALSNLDQYLKAESLTRKCVVLDRNQPMLLSIFSLQINCLQYKLNKN